MTTEIDEARDWRGDTIRCADCAHRDYLALGKCRLQHACVQDRYARRIDRFFRWNPQLAREYLEHAYFELRAVATKHVDVFHLPRMLDDPDGTVRLTAVQRLPARLLRRLREDPDREVRIRVAARLKGADLIMMNVALIYGPWRTRIIMCARWWRGASCHRCCH